MIAMLLRPAIAALGLFAFLFAVPASAAPIETAAGHAVLLDYETGTVLLEKEADDAMPPASMSKLMTLYMVFDKLKQRQLKLDDTLPVSERAWRMQGSKMFVAGRRPRARSRTCCAA